MEAQETFVSGLLEILKRRGVVKADEAEAMKKVFHDRSKVAFDDFLLEAGLVQRSDLLNALSEYYKVPAFDVLGYWFRRMLLKKFPKDFLVRNRIIPVEVDQNILVVVASKPDDPNLLPLIGEHVSYTIGFMVGLGEDIDEAVREFYDKSPSQVEEDREIRDKRQSIKQLRKSFRRDDEE